MNFNRLTTCVAAVLFLGTTTCMAQANEGVPALKAFTEAHITGGRMKMLEEKDVAFIKSLDADRLLFHFRQLASVPNPEGVQSYGGWESTDLRGHTLGHYLTAMSIWYAQSGDREMLGRIQHVVEELSRCQQALGNGYISAFSDKALDRVEADGSGWAPYYTLHKILQGLLDAYAYTGNADALKAASWFGDYIYGRTTRLTDKEKWHRNLDIMEIGGFAESMLNLYRFTQNDKHLQAGQFFQQMDKLEPSANGIDKLHEPITSNYHHANSTIPQFVSAAREYELTGNGFMLRAARNFWDNVVGHRSYANGSTSFHEHWNLPPDQLSREMDVSVGETCCTNNLIRLSHDLFRFTRQSKYPEYVERATLNHIMGSMNPETANFMYFHTQLPGSYKTFARNTDVFFCCTGTGMENHVRYAQASYFADADTMYVCQYFPATVDWKEQDLTLRMETAFPEQESAKLHIEGNGSRATLKLRIPEWCKKFKVKVNGKSVKSKQHDGFLIVTRQWQKNDCMEIALPMTIHYEALADAPDMIALYYGPILLAADLGKEGMEGIDITDNFYGGYPDHLKPTSPIPSLHLAGSAGSPTNERLSKSINKLPGKLEFETTATSDGTPLRLVPLYMANGFRFADYLQIKATSIH